MSNPGKCPHGHPHPISAVYRMSAVQGPRRDDTKTVVIHDSRECPECLQIQIAEANTLLNRFAPRVIDAETYRLWADYVVRYNP